MTAATVPTRRRRLALLLALGLLLAVVACGAGAGGPAAVVATAWRVTTGATAPPGAADGYLPDGESVAVDADVPAVSGLDPMLRAALQDAARDAAGEGVDLRVTSGWRSPTLQHWLFERAVQEHGGASAAAAWVAPGDTSRHLRGEAVDVGPYDAADWLSRHGATWGLCRVHANEAWHFELGTAPGGTCPELRPDAAG